jgi:CBS domain-containing protein
MKAHEIMISPVYTVKESDSIRSVIEKFIQYRISGLPVVNDKSKIVAYISDGDIMRYIGKHENVGFYTFEMMAYIKGDEEDFKQRTQRILNINVMMIAQRKVITVLWDEEIENIAALLGKKQIKKLPVERDGKLVGIISRGDVIRHSFKEIL